MDFGLSPAHTPDKLKSAFDPATRSGVLADQSDWIAYRHHIAEVVEVRVRKVQSYSDYIKNSKFETINIFERGNIQMT